MDERQNHNNRRDRLKVFAGLVALTFAVTLAVVIGNRLSDQALAVLAGAVCGVGAAIPTSLLVVVVSRRRDERRVPLSAQPSMQHGVYPPVVVVAPPGGQQRVGDWNALSPPLTAPTPRQFTVVGGAPEAQRVNAEVNPYGYYA
jgi:anti-sigma factor RsiW